MKSNVSLELRITKDITYEAITENTNDYEAQNGEESVLKFVNFQDQPEQVREFNGFPDLRLDMHLIQSSRHNWRQFWRENRRDDRERAML